MMNSPPIDKKTANKRFRLTCFLHFLEPKRFGLAILFYQTPHHTFTSHMAEADSTETSLVLSRARQDKVCGYCSHTHLVFGFH